MWDAAKDEFIIPDAGLRARECSVERHITDFLLANVRQVETQSTAHWALPSVVCCPLRVR